MDDLVLYYSPTCPYSQKVLRFLQNEGISLTLASTLEFSNQQRLIEAGGKYQVPCLFIGKKALYESNDIIDYLKERYFLKSEDPQLLQSEESQPGSNPKESCTGPQELSETDEPTIQTASESISQARSALSSQPSEEPTAQGAPYTASHLESKQNYLFTQAQHVHLKQYPRETPPPYKTPFVPTARHAGVDARPVRRQRRSSANGISFLIGLVGVVVGALLATLILFFATGGFSTFRGPGTYVGNGQSLTPIIITPQSEDPTLAEVVAYKVMPSIVNIDVYTTTSGSSTTTDNGSHPQNVLRRFGLGSGIIISSDGYILTNYHVLEGGDRFLVNINGADRLEATLVGSDPQSDLAILKVDAIELVPIEIRDSSEVRVGEWVMAVGSPFGLERSVSTGIVSALFRSTTLESTDGINIYANLIQTDAAINPGNSGGALVDSQGRLIGVTTLISSSSGSNSGVGFAIPSNYAMNIAEQIMSGEPVKHAFLGVTLQTVNSVNASQLGVSVSSGVYIDSVVPGSPADGVDIRRGDVVIAFNGKAVNSATELIIDVRGQLVGDTVTLTIVRGIRTFDVVVTLGADTDA
ncbi:MAG: trypsin-like peptidase domain-containing protein [Coriobacteriia bacterium]|nr:trypsin-like peptidase domain-containing protein [Coriobacteriia bacterium]